MTKAQDAAQFLTSWAETNNWHVAKPTFQPDESGDLKIVLSGLKINEGTRKQAVNAAQGQKVARLPAKHGWFGPNSAIPPLGQLESTSVADFNRIQSALIPQGIVAELKGVTGFLPKDTLSFEYITQPGEKVGIIITVKQDKLLTADARQEKIAAIGQTPA